MRFFVTALFLLAAQMFAWPAAASSSISEPLKLAIDDMKLQCASQPSNQTLAESLGLLVQYTGDVPGTIAAMEAADKVNPTMTTANLLFNLANNYKAAGRNDDAVRTYARALFIQPATPVFLILLAMVLDYVGESKHSLRSFATARRLGLPERMATWERTYCTAAVANAAAAHPAVTQLPVAFGRRGQAGEYLSCVHGEITKGTIQRYRRTLLGEAYYNEGFDGNGGFEFVTSGVVYNPSKGVGTAIQKYPGYRGACLWKGPLNFLVPRVLGSINTFEMDANRAQTMLRELQFGARDTACNQRRRIVLQLGRPDGQIGRHGKEVHGFGMGAAMHVITAALSLGLQTNRMLVLPQADNWWYTDPRFCESRSFLCYFDKISRCTKAPKKMKALTESNVWSDTLVLSSPTRLDGFVTSEKVRLWMPKQFAHRGLLWWRAQLASFIFKPNQATMNIVSNRINEAGLKLEHSTPSGIFAGNVVGIHVRHGDKKTESAIVPVENYLEAASQLFDDGQRPQIFLASDEKSSIDRAIEWAQAHGSDLFLDSSQVGLDVSSATDQSILFHDISAREYALDAISSLSFLQRCSHFVGTFSSNFGRLAYELAFINTGGQAAPVSLDTFWHAYP